MGAQAAFTATSICVPSGLTQYGSATATFGSSGSDTNTGVTSFSGGTCTVSTATTRAVVAEIKGNVSTVADPSISPLTGTQTSGPQTVTITDATSGATICYRTDGTAPAATTAGTCDAGSTTYSGTFTVGASGSNSVTTIKAIGTKSGSLNSAVVTSTITIQYAATPTISPAAGTYFSQQTITLACSTGSPSIYYTTDGSTPTTSSTLYTGTFSGASSGSQTIKALCTATGYGNSAVASSAYVIAPSDTAATVSGYKFNDVYDANLEINHVQQMPLDYGPTRGKWTAVGSIAGDLGVQDAAPNALVTVRPAIVSVTGGYAAGSETAGTWKMSAYTAKVGFSADQWASAKRVAGTETGVIVRGDTSGPKTAYYVIAPSAGPLELGKFVAGVKTIIASGGGYSTGSTLELRVAGSSLQVLVDGSVPAGLSANYIDTSIVSGAPGIIAGNGYLSEFSAGNIGVADSTTTPILTYPTYTDPMNTSSWALSYPWFQAVTPYWVKSSTLGAAWGNPFVPKLVSGSNYALGVNDGGSGIISYRGGLFGSDQWERVKIATEPHNAVLSNWFVTPQHRTFIPGTDGGCAAAGTTNFCFDVVSYYVGVETFASIDSGGAGCGGKEEYGCTPFLHITKVTPARTDDKVETVSGGYYTPRAGDELYVEYVAPHLSVACKGHAAEATWQANHAYTLHDYIVDQYGDLQMVKAAGTSGLSAPTWTYTWGFPVEHTGSTTTDGGVTWEYMGQPCPTSDKFSWVINAVDSDLAGASGIPALWIGNGSSSIPTPVFYGFSAGTATSSTACALDSNLCTFTVVEQVRGWDWPY